MLVIRASFWEVSWLRPPWTPAPPAHLWPPLPPPCEENQERRPLGADFKATRSLPASKHFSIESLILEIPPLGRYTFNRKLHFPWNYNSLMRAANPLRVWNTKWVLNFFPEDRVLLLFLVLKILTFLPPLLDNKSNTFVVENVQKEKSVNEKTKQNLL